MTDLITLHQRVMTVTTGGVTAAVGAEQLSLPTPCGDWDLARLLAHMTGQNHGFAAVARGETRDATVFADHPVGKDPAGTLAASAGPARRPRARGLRGASGTRRRPAAARR